MSFLKNISTLDFALLHNLTGFTHYLVCCKIFLIPENPIIFTPCLAAVTSVLWWTYYEIKCKLDSELPEHLLLEEIANEEAYKWYSIVSTILTVSMTSRNFYEFVLVHSVGNW